MKMLVLGVIVLASMSSFGSETIKAIINCDIALDMDQKYIDLNKNILAKAFDTKVYNSDFKKIEQTDFPLDQEFVLKARYERIVGRVVKTEVILKQRLEEEGDSSVVFKKTSYGSSR